MKDVYEVLREKEAALKRVKIEVLALKVAAQLLAEDTAVGMLRPEPLLDPAQRQT